MARSATVEPSAQGLKLITLLEGIPLPALEELARQCRWRRVAEGQHVISRDARDNDVYLIVAGRVRAAAYSAGGRQVTFREIRAGEWFGELAAIDGLSRSADIVALEDSLVAALTPSMFRRLLHEHAIVCDRVLLRLVSSVRELSERVFEFSSFGVQNRVHAELLRLARQFGIKNNTARLDPAPGHAQIASNISTYREQVTRELSAMAKQGLVKRSGRALVIPNVQQLESIVSSMRRSG